jgi:DNA polymerase-3 subunit alpha
MLQDVMDNHAKKLTVHVKLEELAEHRINTLKEVMKMHKGDGKLHFVVHEKANKIQLTMPSRKQKVSISNELLNKLTQLEVPFKVN